MAIVLSSDDLRAFRCIRRNRKEIRQSQGTGIGAQG